MTLATIRGFALAAAVVGGSLWSGAAAAQINVNGYGHYCSATWPTGGWIFTSDTNGKDPCAPVRTSTDRTGSIQRAGIYHASGVNTVIARCNGNVGWQFVGNGNGPLTAAFNAAKGKAGCIFTVAPKDLPIFDSPFKSVTPRVSNGFDFARPPYNNLNVADFGQSGPSNAMIVNFRGDDRAGRIDNHDGYDFLVPEGTKIYALADGVVHANRNLDTKCSGSNSPIQGEMYIRHTIVRSPPTYNEIFIAGYFHLKKRADLAVGASVKTGDYLGDIGWVGCSSESHLHFGITRTTNVAGHRFPPFRVPNNETEANNGGPWQIDPYGFNPPKNLDPWGWRAFPDGALSINLWKSGGAPPLGDWGP